MKSVGITIFVALIVVVMALYLISFQVREIESALVTTFGKPTRQITEPGWYFKWPAPIQRVYKFDSRMRVYEADLGETTTEGAIPIIVNTYVVWRIAEPLQFFNAVGTVQEAKSKLYSQISDTQNRIVGQYSFGEFVNSDPKQIKFAEIEQNMLDEIKQPVRENYGIEIKTLGIKQLKVSEDVSKNVFDRMQAERTRRTKATISEGEAQKKRIMDEADGIKTELLAAAKSRAKAIRGEGDAQAAKYYEKLEAEPKLAIFLRNLEALAAILKERATIVIPAEAAPFNLLKNIPDFEPTEPNKPTEANK
jgi:membrane protease subunit HflC